ncbi:E3 ubiquitin-protein ligase Praja-1-like protein [Cinnamomum micranthum f. kanehirae]|uniref:E3 ubiquitin-protein ligase Praja-1-like protein n=1 Tax=Cinnamomum micranthum f. kanehirae TaxID=337451 RepID=A0A443PCA3_9MAGN|nr:E3 ubiquitin-protein ligase Praja-1-like protein [Cinnamomum micranthum f. kanehirae]
MASNQHRHSIQNQALVITAEGSMGKPGEGEEKEATLSLRLKEIETWLARSSDGAAFFGVDRRETSSPWKNFTTCMSDLWFPESLDWFLASAISEMGISNWQAADQIRMTLPSFVNEAATNVNAMGRCFKNLSIQVTIEISTDHWFDETWVINRALRESQNSNYNVGFGAVPATEAAIATSLSAKIFKKDVQQSKESCTVCLEELVEETQLNQLPCLHVFHRDCIIEWLRQSNCCPVCRFKVQEEAA